MQVFDIFKIGFFFLCWFNQFVYFIVHLQSANANQYLPISMIFCNFLIVRINLRVNNLECYLDSKPSGIHLFSVYFHVSITCQQKNMQIKQVIKKLIKYILLNLKKSPGAIRMFVTLNWLRFRLPRTLLRQDSPEALPPKHKHKFLKY